MTAGEPKTIAEILTTGAEFLSRKGVENPALVCKLLLARLLRCKPLELTLRFPETLTEIQLAAMRRGIRRAAAGEPVQYVTGEAGFMGHLFRVDRRALIPRPETEGLVERVLEYEPLWALDRPRIVDIGTGSGCIVISLAIARPNASYAAFDISPEAIQIAAENAALLGAADRIGFFCEDLSDVVEAQAVDAVISNPPYIPTAEWEKLPAHIRNHEPRVALDGGPRGLTVIERVVQDASNVLASSGVVFLEIGETQARGVSSLLEGAGFQDVTVLRDLAGRDRVVRAILP